MYLDLYGCELHYPEMFESTLRYLSFATNELDCDDTLESREQMFFDLDEICFIMMLSYALLSVKNNPTMPFDLVEYYESQITEKANIEQLLSHIQSYRNCDQREIPWDKMILLTGNWGIVKEMFFFDIQNIASRYTQDVNIDIRFTPVKWDLGNWKEEDLADWICYLEECFGAPQYNAEKAKHFIKFWEQKSQQTPVVNAIEEWSKRSPESFASNQLWKVRVRCMTEYREYLKHNPFDTDQLETDRAQAIKELYEYVETLHLNTGNDEVENKEQQIIPEVQTTSSVRLKLNDKKGPNNLINTVRIFNVLHELGFFTDDKGLPITKKALFEGLANTFGCSELTDWSNKLSSARGQAAGSRNADLKIFDILKQAQEAYLDRLDDQAEQRYR